jgi:hypothetical protein
MKKLETCLPLPSAGLDDADDPDARIPITQLCSKLRIRIKKDLD